MFAYRYCNIFNCTCFRRPLAQIQLSVTPHRCELFPNSGLHHLFTLLRVCKTAISSFKTIFSLLYTVCMLSVSSNCVFLPSVENHANLLFSAKACFKCLMWKSLLFFIAVALLPNSKIHLHISKIVSRAKMAD